MRRSTGRSKGIHPSTPSYPRAFLKNLLRPGSHRASFFVEAWDGHDPRILQNARGLGVQTMAWPLSSESIPPGIKVSAPTT